MSSTGAQQQFTDDLDPDPEVDDSGPAVCHEGNNRNRNSVLGVLGEGSEELGDISLDDVLFASIPPSSKTIYLSLLWPFPS